MRFGLIVRAFTSPYLNRKLIFSLTRRDISQRYRSSALGPVWLFAQPLLLLALYSFVFQVVLRARWGIEGATGSPVPFGLILFVGLVLHTILSDTLVRAPATITAQESLVKRVIFPLEILPVVNVASSLMTAFLSFIILTAAMIVFAGFLYPTSIMLLVPILGLALFTTGLGWILAALGVYLRDLNQIMPLFSTLLLFTAPVVYPRSMVPDQFQFLLAINPLTIPVEWSRAILFEGAIWHPGAEIFLILSAVVYVIGYGFFRMLRREFADVL
ncbi:ABC transporter permease [Affinirhizobium pseudoryzae]|uniref:ABC transporter permease n=1 Tax=Allorhizobium pseudoryzae TaxID=379684 RepID=UPI0013EC731A|nr:ABC transporter permease [Allorhizobium pseudoryzae]